jgi:hypothetical protein
MKRRLLFSVVFLCVALMSASAYAVSFGLEIEYTGAFEPEGPMPWLAATFEDTGTNEVTLTMDATNLRGSEFVGGWYFNVDETFLPDPLALDFDYQSGPIASVARGANRFMAGNNLGDGFDIRFNFPQPSGSRFGAGQISIYEISINPTFGLDPDGQPLDGLVAESFNFVNEPRIGTGTFFSAAHVQGIGPSGDDSGWIAATGTTDIPEAASVLSLGLGILGIGLIARKRRFR